MNNATLAAWAAIVDAPVLGRVGHHRTYAAGPAHPAGQHPAWVQAAGVSLALLHVAYAAHQIAKARDLGDSSAHRASVAARGLERAESGGCRARPLPRLAPSQRRTPGGVPE